MENNDLPRLPLGPVTVDRAPSGIVQFFCNDALGRLCMFDGTRRAWSVYGDSDAYKKQPVLPLDDFTVSAVEDRCRDALGRECVWNDDIRAWVLA